MLNLVFFSVADPPLPPSLTQPENSWKMIEAGANAIVSGSGVFGAKDYAAAIKGIKNSKRP